MMHWLTKLFSQRAKQHPRQGYIQPRTRLNMEELTPRDLPNSHLLGSSLGSFFEARQSSNAIISHRTSDDNSSHEGKGGQCGADATYSATLSNATGATGIASYLAGNNSLKISVKGAAASSTLDIQLDGVSIGSLTTDATGNGKVTLTDLTAVVNANSVLTVGDLTGTFTQVIFSATLTGSVSTQTGTAGYNTLKHSLNLYFTGAAAKTVYSVLIDGVSVGTLTTNKSGAGKFHLDLSTLDIKAGTVIAITDSTNTTIYQGTFA
ncbi:MAG TPA: hypothetical protein PLN21_16795 [Gemmatales bacterium]|nr:hypothetical protein [Gemmatales bacterium]